MCGIVGYYGKTAPERLTKAVNSIKHRGPDDSGTETFENLGLGNVRLAIVDLSENGHMPMFSSDKNIAITYNGEIYNFLEVKKELEPKYNFISGSDTEVIINAYREWGIDCLQKLNGMFAFVIYDKSKNLLFGARDRLGEKPLKYYYKNDQFIFSSEIKGILELLESKPDIDPIAIDNFLTYQYVPAPKTGFKDIYKLPPAHYFILKDKKLEIKQYWSTDYTQKLDLSRERWGEKILQELEQATKQRLIADVEIGSFLSGGIDSSATTAFMARNAGRKIKTFSMGFDDPKFDETKYAKMVSEKYDTDHYEFKTTSQELLDNFDNIFSHYDEPFADNSALPTFLLSKHTSKHLKVVLNGDGGDENFAGYDRYNIVAFSEIYKTLPKPLRTAFIDKAASIVFKLKGTKLTERIKRFSNTFEQPFYKRYVEYNSVFNNNLKSELYEDSFRQLVKDNDSFEYYKGFYNQNLDDLDNALNIDMQTYLPEDLLFKTDIASMAFGLELRAPFLDYKFIELMAKMPSSLKIKNFDKKSILKEALVENDILPREVVYRPKQGFNIPLNSWFKGPLKDYLNDNLLSGLLVSGNIVKTSFIERHLDKYYSSDLNFDMQIYILLCLEKFLQKWS